MISSREMYVSLLYSEDFLPGVLVLSHSLKKVQSTRNLVVLLTSTISSRIRHLLKLLEIETRDVEIIVKPGISSAEMKMGMMYTKLNIFGLTEYSKLVYLDADMLVHANCDDLFSKKHMSAVNTGGELPEFSQWTDLNAGMLVIEPDSGLFEDMQRAIPFLPSKDGSDQGYLHSYYPDWKTNNELHLHHGYNMYPGFLVRYSQMQNFRLYDDLKIFHYWGPEKPWDPAIKTDDLSIPHQYSISLWRDYWDECVKIMRLRMSPSK